ncbi:MAG: hypothetical protein CMJ18_01700 [Phycisphaeraceae bacterium]|nr:hypothetical protein [Phycisphaeraceae bacterium]
MNYWSYISNIVRPHRRRIVFAMMLSMGQTVLSMAPALGLAVLIDLVITAGRYNLLGPIIILLLLVPVCQGAVRMVNGYIVELLGQRLVFDIRLDLYRRVHRLSSAFMQSTSTGKLMERIRGDVELLQRLLTEETLSLVVQLITGMVTLAVMLALSAKLTLVVVAAIGLYVLNYHWFVRRIRKVQRRFRRKMDALSGIAQERLSASIAVKAFGRERAESRHFVRRDFAAERVQHRYRSLNNAYSVTSSLIGGATQTVVLLAGTYLVIQGQITYGTVMAIAALATRLIDPAIQLAEISNVVQQAKVSLDRIFELMNAERDSIDEPGLKLDHLRGEVAFHIVGFRYEMDKPVLRNLNLYVQPHQTVALVGETGCGKTTITNLLYRYYEPQAGHLEIDGHDITKLDARWYRRQLALVPQDPIVFDTTIAQNIAYGRPRAARAEIERAARAAELGGLLDTLPLGIDTPLGDYGVKLSVGERQRLCIARAILADPAILILDEATSSLDPHAEAQVQQALRRVMANRTCFVIAHRLSTIVEADIIVVLDAGRVLEMGSHTQLIHRRDGRYRELFETQMRHDVRAGLAS